MRRASIVAVDAHEEPTVLAVSRLGEPAPDPPDWVDGAPTTGRDQSCAFCDDPEVGWVHPLDPDLVRYEEHGREHTLPTFWALCDRCEAIHRDGDVDRAVAVMRATAWSWVEDDDVEESLRRPLEVFRRADRGGRRVDAGGG